MRWPSFFRTRERREADLDEEIQFHLTMEAQDRISRGEDPEEVEHAVRREFGNIARVKEVTREMWGWARLDRLRKDLRYALRGLRRAPAFTATAVLILALGIGMATAMFTVFNTVLLQQTLPVSEPDRIVHLWSFRDPSVTLAITQPQLEGLRRESQTLQDAAGVVHWGAQPEPLTDGDRPLVLSQAMVTANFFAVLGARPTLGRLLRPEDGSVGAAAGMVISYGAWQRQFGGDPSVIGRRLTTTYDQQSYEILGVAPVGLDYPVGTEYWIPARPSDFVNVIARLTPEVTPSAARSEFLSLIQQLDLQRPDPRHPTDASVETLTEAVLGDVRPVLLTLTAAVALLLLIASVNVCNLLLLRATLRAREVVIRQALGGSYWRILRMLLVEASVVAVAGGMMGLVLAEALLRVLLTSAPAQLPRTDLIRFAGNPVVVGAVVTLTAMVLFATLPALTAARANLATALRSDPRAGRSRRLSNRVRQLLVATQVALAVVMLSGAGLLVHSLQRLDGLALGYDADRLAIVSLAIPFTKYESTSQFYSELDVLTARLRALPGVTSLSPVLYPPFVGANLMQISLILEGQLAGSTDSNPVLPAEAGGPDYFRTFGIPILRGRGFLETDREDTPKVVVVSEAVAGQLWPDQDAVGKRLRFDGADSTEWRTVVGVAGDIRYRRLQESTPMLFVPWRQLNTFGVLAVRTDGNPASVLPLIRRTVRDFDPQMDVWDARTMNEHLAGPLAQPRLSTLLLSGFGLVALVMAATGLYGIMATMVRERTHDVGVRMALGASPERLRRQVLAGALNMTAVGTAVGLASALLGSRMLAALLYEVSPTDPATLVGVCILLLSVALFAAYFPARRATRVNPVEALRAD